MKIIRLQIPGNFLEHVGFAELFQELEFVEILNAFQYDQTHFFTLQKIRFKANKKINLNDFITHHFKPQSFQLLSKLENEIVCIMNQNKTSGFFPIVDSGPWAFLFPIHISNELLLINIISQEEYLTQLYKILDSFTQNYKIISTVDLDNIDQYDKNIWKSAIPYPKFTKRQIDIASYAARNGYFKSPKKISGRKIADHFKISVTAVNNHLKKARNIAMEYFFGSF
ncbi:MAG: hypothetical protein EU552_02770 [Promethearchaeota archaeon]|nr:MAG: hypothetical protein EU552_02770 [Candidatus Lokiarchaeota archaeon]